MSASLTSGVSSFFSSYGILIVLMVAMFAIMIIPQRRRDKKVKDMLGSLKAADGADAIAGLEAAEHVFDFFVAATLRNDHDRKHGDHQDDENAVAAEEAANAGSESTAHI